MDAQGWQGRKIGGRYQIEELLGQGGMSSVFKAFDPNLQRMVAIKLVHSHLSNNQEFVRRFEVEATAVARLRHPNIIQVYDFNHDGGIYFMVLEYVAGETLQQRIKRLNAAGRQLPLEDALRFTIDICKAADYAHQRGMVHRDIKPANVMLDMSGNAILMDFGIARIMGGQQHTATGAVLGTALYMSPEQIQGLHPDNRADIYSIGVMLFESLSGRPPFEADSVMTLMMMHMKDPVPDIDSLHPGIPAAVTAIVNRALEKDRANRYQSAGDMAAALQKVLDRLAPQPADELPVGSATMLEDVAPIHKTAAATMIEDDAQDLAQATFIQEQAPVDRKAAVHTERTMVEQSRPAPTGGKPAAGAASVEVKSAPRANLKLIIPLVIVLLLAVVGGGLAAAGVFTPRATEPVAAIIAMETPVATDMPALPTETEAVAAPVELPTVTVTDAPEAEPTEAPTEAPTQAPTLEPTATDVPQLKAPVIGGADKIAFVRDSDLWAANLDGSELTQLTSDGTAKKYLRWLPDGTGLTYISGKCILTVSLSGEGRTIVCFNNASSVDSFEVSPDGSQVALSVDVQMYLLPFDMERLAQANTHPKLAAMADCKELAPYQRNAVYQSRWSADSKELAVVIMGVLDGGRRGDIVQTIRVDRCIANPLISLHFPNPHFTFREYEREGRLHGLTWDGENLFAMNGNTRNDGFGDLHLFNRAQIKATLMVNPINNSCCYRDPVFSPDGSYLLFAFQDIKGADHSVTQLYYVSFGTLGTGARYEPLPIPEFTNQKEQPQAVLRRVAAP